jgi:hypothetical protein
MNSLAEKNTAKLKPTLQPHPMLSQFPSVSAGANASRYVLTFFFIPYTFPLKVLHLLLPE